MYSVGGRPRVMRGVEDRQVYSVGGRPRVMRGVKDRQELCRDSEDNHES